MGGKTKGLLAGVLGVAAIWSTAGGAAPWVVGLLQGATVVVGGLAARDAQKRAKQAQRDALQDRKVMYRSGVSSKGYVYGQVWMSGAIAYHRSPKSKADPYFWIVLALPIKHRIKSIDGIYFGDREVTPLAPNGDSTSPEFTRIKVITGQFSGKIPPGNIVTLPMDVPGGDAAFVLGPLQGYEIVCATKAPDPLTNTGEDTYQDWNKSVTGTLIGTNQLSIPGTVGYDFQVTYRYQTTSIYIRAWTYRGTDDQVANTDLIAATINEVPDMRWDSSCRLRGVPYIILRIRPDDDIFPKELDNITVRLSGKDDILDARTGLEIHTDNSMLVARDYAIAQCGVIPGDIQIPAFNAEVNVCEEVISQPDPITGLPVDTRRFTTNCFLSTESSPKDNLSTILSSCDGSVVECGATVDFRCGHYEEPSLALDDSDFASDPEIVKGPEMADTFNGIKPRYTDTSTPFWPVVDGTEYLSQFYLNKDKGRVSVEEVDLLATGNGTAAFRLAKQMLHRHRAGMTLTALFKLKAEQLAPMQTVWLTHRSIGNDEKVYRVMEMDPVSLTSVKLTLQEDGPLLYQWDFDEAAGVDPAPNSNLPSVLVVPLIQGLGADTSVAAMVRGPDGNLIAQCRVYWSPVTDPLVLRGGHIEVRYKRSIDKDWNRTQELPPLAIEHRFPIFRNDVLIIEARLANSLVGGRWTQLVRTANDTPAPYIVSENLIQNAELFWGTLGASGDNYESDYPTWDRYQLRGATVTKTGLVSAYGGSLGNQSGYIIIQHEGASPAVGDKTWLRSAAFPVSEGKPYVLSGRARPPTSGTSSIYMRVTFTANGVYVGEFVTNVLRYWTGSFNSLDQTKIMSRFGIVPLTANEGTVDIMLEQMTTTPFDSATVVGRPYFGDAAEGQISVPPWRS